MNKMTRILSLVMVLVLACAMISTAGAEDYGFIGKKSKPVKLTVHENSKCGLAKGGKIQLKMAGRTGRCCRRRHSTPATAPWPWLTPAEPSRRKEPGRRKSP